MIHSRFQIMAAGCLACVLVSASPAWAAGKAVEAPAGPVVQATPPAAAGDAAQPAVDKKRLRFNVDRKIIASREAKGKGDWATAEKLMLEAVFDLGQIGYEQDQARMLREMTLEPVEGKPEAAKKYVQSGKRGLAEFYYRRYLAVKPRDAQWLLEALAWANYAGAEDLLKRFSARTPNKAHENIDERALQHAKELQVDDALFIAFERLRIDTKNTYGPTLKSWPYPVDQRHSQLGTSLLHMAVWFNRAETVRLLVEDMHAAVNIEDNEKDTPMDYALHLDNKPLAAYLKSKGGKANRKHDKPAQKQAEKPADKPAGKAAAKPAAASPKPAAVPATNKAAKEPARAP